MSITDELRAVAAKTECANGRCEKLYRGDLDHIADRIDAEHERLMQEQPFTIDMVPMTDERMAEHGWVRLPVDADGEYIHIGDVMETENFGVVEVEGFIHKAIAFSVYAPQPARICTVPASQCRHHHEPTVEDVLREFGIDWEYESDCEDRAALLAEYAAKLRLAGDAE